MRNDGRKPNQLRPIKLTTNVSKFAEGSALIEFGETKVLCTATVEAQAPKWLQGTQKGWVTAEYSMLPRSTQDRIRRDKALTCGRTQEIARLIGRSLRAGVDLSGLAERQIIIDCDVIQADAGTRTAAITGGFVALILALQMMRERGQIHSLPIKSLVAAVSVGLGPNGPLLDLNYLEDSKTQTDMNFVMNEQGLLIEIQGTAEADPFSQEQLLSLLDFARTGCEQLFDVQRQAFRERGLRF